MTGRFDYDEGDIHRTYAAGRALTAAQAAFWPAILREELAGAAIGRVLDLGCGVGRYAAVLRATTATPVLGIDRSERMLATAAADPALRGTWWVRADAGALPVREGSVALVWLFLVYHHLPDPVTALRECARVLAGGGTVIVVNSTTETLDAHRWLPFFPSARDIDRARLPSRAGLTRAAEAAGLVVRRHRTVLNPVAPDLRAYADRIASRTISTLRLVPDAEFAEGIAAFRRHCEAADRGQPVEDAIDMFVLGAPPRDAESAPGHDQAPGPGGPTSRRS